VTLASSSHHCASYGPFQEVPCDFRKAFDAVSHSPLLSKLHEIGLDSNIISWVHNYLAERRQFVVYNGASSHSTPVVSGVPQGSILGPLLFLIYIDDICQLSLSPGSRLVLYADDILLYRPISCSSNYHLFQADINGISNWATQNKMTFNVSKCKAMHISRKRYPHLPPMPLALDGNILDVVPTFK